MKTEQDIAIDFPEVKIENENGKKTMRMFRQVGERQRDLGYIIKPEDDAYRFASRMVVIMDEWEKNL